MTAINQQRKALKEKEKEAWKNTDESKKIITDIDKSRILLLHGLPVTGKTTLIKSLGFITKDQQAGTKDSKLHIDLSNIVGTDKQKKLKQIIDDPQNRNCHIIIEAKTYDLVDLLFRGTLQKSDMKKEAMEIGQRANIIAGKLKEWNSFIPEIRFLSLSHQDVDNLLTSYLESVGLKSAFEALGDKQSKEVRETLLKYSRFSKDDVPELKMPKGKGVYFFEDMKEAVKDLSPAPRNLDLNSYDTLKKKVEQHKLAEKLLLSSPVVLPFIALESVGQPVATIGGQLLPNLLSAFSSFFQNQKGLWGTVINAIVPGIPALGIGIVLLCFFKRKEHKDDFNKTLIELSEFWRSLSTSKRRAIGESYDAVLGTERGATEKTFDCISGISIDELKAKLDHFKIQLDQLNDRVDALEVEFKELREDKLRFLGIYQHSDMLGLRFEEESSTWSILSQDDCIVSKLSRQGSFGNYAGMIKSILLEGAASKIVLTGPKGIGKSTLVAYVLSALLKEGDISVVVDPWRLYVSQNVQSFEASIADQRLLVARLLQSETSESHNGPKGIVIIDPSGKWSGYQELVKGQGLSGMLVSGTSVALDRDQAVRLLDKTTYYYERNFTIIAIIPDDIFDVVGEVFSEKGFREIRIDLKSEDFLEDVVKSYSNLKEVPKLVIDQISQFDNGYTLVAARAGELLASRRDLSPDRVLDIIRKTKNDVKSFLRAYIQEGIVGEGSSDVKRLEGFALALLFHVSFSDHYLPVELATKIPLAREIRNINFDSFQFPVELRMGLLNVDDQLFRKSETGNVVERRNLLERKLRIEECIMRLESVKLGAAEGKGCLDLRCATWISFPKEDLIEETLKELVLGEAANGAQELSKALMTIKKELRIGSDEKDVASRANPSYELRKRESDKIRSIELALVSWLRPLLVLLLEGKEKDILDAFATSITSSSASEICQDWDPKTQGLLCVNHEMPKAVREAMKFEEQGSKITIPLDLLGLNTCKELRGLIGDFCSGNMRADSCLLKGLGLLAATDSKECLPEKLTFLFHFFRQGGSIGYEFETIYDSILNASLESDDAKVNLLGLANYCTHGRNSNELPRLKKGIDRLYKKALEEHQWLLGVFSVWALSCMSQAPFGSEDLVQQPEAVEKLERICNSINPKSAYCALVKLLVNYELTSPEATEMDDRKLGELKKEANQLLLRITPSLEVEDFLEYIGLRNQFDKFKASLALKYEYMGDEYHNRFNYKREFSEEEIAHHYRVLIRFIDTFAVLDTDGNLYNGECAANVSFPVPWTNVISSLIDDLQPFKNMLVIRQVKEKFGELRVYFFTGDPLLEFKIDNIVEKHCSLVLQMYGETY